MDPIGVILLHGLVSAFTPARDAFVESTIADCPIAMQPGSRQPARPGLYVTMSCGMADTLVCAKAPMQGAVSKAGSSWTLAA